MRFHEAAHQLGTGGGRIDIAGDSRIVALPDLAVQINAEHATAIKHAQSAVSR